MIKETLKEKTAKGLLWGSFSNTVQQFLFIGFNIFVARILNSEDYGLIAMLNIFTAFAATMINAGFSTALINRQNTTHSDYNAVFWFTSGMGLFLYIILFFAAPAIADFYRQPELTCLSRVVFVNFFISGASIASSAIIYKQLKTKLVAKINITSVLASCVAGLVLALNGFSYWSLAIQNLIFISGSAILRMVCVSWRPSFTFDFRPLKQMFSFSIKMFLTNLIININNNIFAVALGKFYNSRLLGDYSQGKKWTDVCNQLITGIIIQISHPVLVQVTDNRERELRVFRKMFRFAAFIAFPAFIGLVFIAHEFIVITIGEKWLPSVVILRILCIYGALSPFYLLYTQLIIAHSNSSAYLYGNILMVVIQLIFLAILLRFGIIYVAAGTVMSYMFCLPYWHFVCKKYIDIKLTDVLKDILPYLTVSVVSIFLGWIAALPVGLITSLPFDSMYLSFAIKIAVTASAYLLLLWICGSKLLHESVEMLRQYVKK
ncbi:MAG: lipopolysaccharide biosynthesis protein [Prevotellaceae bacterium]|jgi:O-antigen/teichoic acid export membrane protein|nr:lipopolysaccharide biosynthesis protein [Prevotellaceae bacterium]